MTTIICAKCGEGIELSEALTKDIEKTILSAEHERHKLELEKAKSEVMIAAKKESEAAVEIARKKYEGEVEVVKKEAETEIELIPKP